MTFLNTTLLLAVAAIGIPIVLHLTARREPKQVSFPSIRLLKRRFETNRTKIRVRRWWLLALRILAIAAVAFALAGPIIQGQASIVWSTIAIVAAFAVALLALGSLAASRGSGKSLTYGLLIAGALMLSSAVGWGVITAASADPPQLDASRPVALVILVDNGPMSYWREGSTTQIDSLRRASKDLLLAVHPESRLALVDRSSTPATFALDLAGAVSKADALEPLENAQSLTTRFDAALRLLASSEFESKQLVLIGSAGNVNASSEALETSLGRASEIGARFTFWNIENAPALNRRLSLPVLSDQTPAPQTPITVTATVSVQGAGESAVATDQGSEDSKSSMTRVTA
ncbi:MAG: BatA domain-containing protein, partial [Planctomycetota bacterium]